MNGWCGLSQRQGPQLGIPPLFPQAGDELSANNSQPSLAVVAATDEMGEPAVTTKQPPTNTDPELEKRMLVEEKWAHNLYSSANKKMSALGIRSFMTDEDKAKIKSLEEYCDALLGR